HLARFDIQADQRGRKQIGAGTMSAIGVVGGVLYVEVYIAEFFVGGERSPHTGVAGVIGRAFQPRVIAKLALSRDGMENPELLTCADVEGCHVALYVVVRRGTGRQSGAHD